MKKIYLVSRGSYSDYHIEGIYTNEALANLAAFPKNFNGYLEEPGTVDEWTEKSNGAFEYTNSWSPICEHRGCENKTMFSYANKGERCGDHLLKKYKDKVSHVLNWDESDG